MMRAYWKSPPTPDRKAAGLKKAEKIEGRTQNVEKSHRERGQSAYYTFVLFD
jgi:hypothetical protein